MITISKEGSQFVARNADNGIVYKNLSAVKTINAAIKLGANALLKDGIYPISGANILISEGASLQGESATSTIIQFNTAHQIRVDYQNCRLSNFKITGKPLLAIGITASHNLVENVIATVDGSQDLAFVVWVSNTTIEDIEFRNCAAHDCGRTGFYAEGDGATQIIKNLKYINCQAINCGKATRHNPWVVGFDLGEGPLTLDNLFMQGCYATGSWESGFHLENSVLIKNSIIEGCISNGNGRDKVDPSYAAGFFLHSGITLKDCTANDNMFGVKIEDRGPDPLQAINVDISVNGNVWADVILSALPNMRVSA